MANTRAPRFKIPEHPELESALNALSAFVDTTRNPEIRGGRGISVIASKDAVVIEDDGFLPGAMRHGRFITSFEYDRQRLYVGAGSVIWRDPAKDQQTATPEIPQVNGKDVGDPEGFIDISDLESGKDYSVTLKLDRDHCTVELLDDDELESAAEEDELDMVVLGNVKFKEGDGENGQKVVDSMTPLWESDVVWVSDQSESSSETSSLDSSEAPSSGEDSSAAPSEPESEKSSNAIVRMSHHPTGYGALATIESNQVLFEFVIRGVPLSGRITRWKIDPRFQEWCEPGSLCIASAPAGDRPLPLSAVVDGDYVILRALPFLRPRSATFRLTGIRRGFLLWDAPARTERQKRINERSLRMMYPR